MRIAPGTPLVIAGRTMPARIARAYRLWMLLALALSRVTTPLLMGLIYFGLFTPIALVRRLAGRPALAMREGASTWVERPEGARASDMRRQF